MRNIILLLIIILSFPFSLKAEEFITGRVKGLDKKNSIIYICPMGSPCKNSFLQVKIPDNEFFDSLTKGELVRISGEFKDQNIFKASEIVRNRNYDPTGVRSRLKNYRQRSGHGKQRRRGNH
ncbi:MAG: hypothetical protein ACQESN_10500 [Thermotogota bacterium]